MTNLSSYHHWLEVAKGIQGEADAAGAGQRHPKSGDGHVDERSLLTRFDERVTIQPLRIVSHRLFANGHYTQAVEAAFKRLNNEVKAKSGLAEFDGDKLMREAFSVNNPRLRLNKLRTISDRDEQRGYMEIYAGVIAAIRNPRSHEHSLEDDPEVALELLTIANHLMRKLGIARKNKRRKATS